MSQKEFNTAILTPKQDDLSSTPSSLSEWETEQAPLEVAEMDQLVATYRSARMDYEAKKQEATDLYHKLEEAEAKVRNALLTSGKSKYFVDGIGTVSMVSKSSYGTPKSIEEKAALFDYIRRTHGQEALMNYLSIHSASLNSFANKELDGNPTLEIPGLKTPTVTMELRFRKE